MRGCIPFVVCLLAVGLSLSPASALSAPKTDDTGPETIVRHLRQGRYLTAKEHLYRLLFSDAELSWKRRAVYLLGHVNLKLGAPEEAAYYFERARGSLPDLADYALYNLGLALAGAGRHEEARRAFSELLDGEPTSRLKPHALLQRAEAARASGAWDEAQADYERLLEGWPGFDDRPLANLRLGQILEAKGEEDSALERYKASVLGGPAHKAAAEALERLDALRATLEPVPPRWTAEEALRLGRGLLGAGRPREALDVLETVRGRGVSSELEGRATLLAAKASLALGRRQEAVGRLMPLIERRPTHPDVPEALYLAGRALWNLNKREEARTYLRRLLHRYRSSPFCEQAFYILGRIYEEQGRFARSVKAFRELAAAYPTGELAREGLWRMGWNAYRRGRLQEAVEVFGVVLPKLASNDWEDEATYWLARSYEESGGLSRANRLYLELVERYPHTYYGQRAAWRLDLNGDRGLLEELSIEPAQTDHSSYDYSSLVSLQGRREAGRLERALELSAMGFLADARQELALLEEALQASGVPRDKLAFALGALYHRSGLYELAIRRLNGPFASMRPEEVLGLDRRFWELYYPLPYRGSVERASVSYGLEASLIMGLIRQESAFDAEAVSPAGAVGLMQLMPGRSEAARGDLLDPEVNLARGAAHLHQLISKYDGNLVYALAAYNAGPHRLERWRRRFRGLKEDEFVEAIPFPETRTYVKRVLRNASIYRMLYFDRGTTSR